MIHTDGTPTIAHREGPVEPRGHAIPRGPRYTERQFDEQLKRLRGLLDPMRTAKEETK